MMGVINLAHGEFIMGAYITVLSARASLPLPLAMLAGRLRPASWDSSRVPRHTPALQPPVRFHVATWAISLIATQGMLIVAGPSIEGLKTPFGSFEMGGLFLLDLPRPPALIALILLAGLYWLFVARGSASISRATIQDADMAARARHQYSRVYQPHVCIGRGVGRPDRGAVRADNDGRPTMGQAFIVQSFVTVVVSGADVMLGLAPAAAVLGFIQSLLTKSYGQLIGQIGLLLTGDRRRAWCCQRASGGWALQRSGGR